MYLVVTRIEEQMESKTLVVEVGIILSYVCAIEPRPSQVKLRQLNQFCDKIGRFSKNFGDKCSSKSSPNRLFRKASFLNNTAVGSFWLL